MRLILGVVKMNLLHNGGDTVERTYCLMCSVRCPVVCRVDNGILVEVTPNLEHPVGGVICPNARAAPEFVEDPKRLRYPMKRTRPMTASDPGWEGIS